MKPKYKIGDTVWMKDEFQFNPSEKAYSIGVIEAIHLKFGESIFKGQLIDRIIYTVSGFSIKPKEEDIKKFSSYNELKENPNG